MSSLDQISLQIFAKSAGFSPLPAGWIRVTGSDRVRWLNGMVTNSVQALASGQGAYSYLLNAQGRIQGDGVIWPEDDALWIETSPSQVEPMMALLDRFIIMDDVELSDASQQRFGIRIAGKDTLSTLQEIGLTATGEEFTAATQSWQGQTIRLQRMPGPLVPRVELWCESADIARAVFEALEKSGAVEIQDHLWQALRMHEGTPQYGQDIRDRDLPQETGQAHALHFNKGCYLGQEIVERIRSRGQVNRTLRIFHLDGGAAEPGAELTAEDKPVGELTSVISSEGKTYAFGYVRREAVERALQISYPQGTAKILNTPIPLVAADIES